MKTVDIDEDSWTEIMKKANKGKWDFPLTLLQSIPRRMVLNDVWTYAKRG